MKRIIGSLFLLLSLGACKEVVREHSEEPDYSKLAIDFVDFQKEDRDVSTIIESFAQSSLEGINKQLSTDTEKLAFWVNVYNGYILYVLRKSPELFEKRSKFFSEKRIQIAGVTMSFSDIEHGVIRRSQIPIFLGKIANPFVSKHEKTLRVSKRNWKVHFALNCGALSCPPVATYHAEFLEHEFNYVTRQYLLKNTQLNEEEMTVETTVLFSWFRGDFGGIKEVKSILEEYQITSERPEKLKFSDYDWTLKLDNYIEIPDK